MLIEVDHLSEWGATEVLEMAPRAATRSSRATTAPAAPWTPEELRQLYELGGFAAVTSGTAPQLAAKLLGSAATSGRPSRRRRARHRHRRLRRPARATDGRAADPLRYPFRSFDGRVTFDRQHTGERSFDLNTDGVAHYGLFADLLADVQRRPRAATRCARCSPRPRRTCGRGSAPTPRAERPLTASATMTETLSRPPAASASATSRRRCAPRDGIASAASRSSSTTRSVSPSEHRSRRSPARAGGVATATARAPGPVEDLEHERPPGGCGARCRGVDRLGLDEGLHEAVVARFARCERPPRTR